MTSHSRAATAAAGEAAHDGPAGTRGDQLRGPRGHPLGGR